MAASPGRPAFLRAAHYPAMLDLVSLVALSHRLTVPASLRSAAAVRRAAGRSRPPCPKSPGSGATRSGWRSTWRSRSTLMRRRARPRSMLPQRRLRGPVAISSRLVAHRRCAGVLSSTPPPRCSTTDNQLLSQTLRLRLPPSFLHFPSAFSSYFMKPRCFDSFWGGGSVATCARCAQLTALPPTLLSSARPIATLSDMRCSSQT